MNKIFRISLLVIGLLLLIVGIGNIIDNSRVLTYDLSSILAGTGFVIISFYKK